MFGQGMYVASVNDVTLNDWIESEMVRYGAKAPHAYTETLTLDKSAKIVQYDDLRSEFRKYIDTIYERTEDLKWEKSTELRRKINNGEMTNEEASKVSREYGRKLDAKVREISSLDTSSYAVLKGYDAITQSRGGGSYTVVLNRTKVIIKED